MQDCQFQQQLRISMELEVIVICWFISAGVKKKNNRRNKFELHGR